MVAKAQDESGWCRAGRIPFPVILAVESDRQSRQQSQRNYDGEYHCHSSVDNNNWMIIIFKDICLPTK